MKILHFSPVKKENQIVKLHLQSLKDLKKQGFDFTYSFFDDNDDVISSKLLNKFICEIDNAILFKHTDIGLDKNYRKEKERWSYQSYNRITIIKNFVIEFFLNRDYDFLFFTDSDLILHPETLNTLIKQNKHFCSEIFWTKFDNTPTYAPNGWYSKPHGYNKHDLLMFREPGTFKVDFTGACTLLSKKILLDKVSFKRIPNLDFLGEDKHFCIRASVLNYDIYLNSEFPAFHLYNLNLIKQGKQFIKSGYNLNYLKCWLDESWEEKLIPWIHPRKKSIFNRLVSFLIDH